MAIKVQDLVYKIRYKVKDFSEVTYSNYDLLEAINECIRYINQNDSLKNSDFLEKTKHYVQEDMNAEVVAYNEENPTAPKKLYNFPVTGAELPEDIISLVDIMRLKDGYHMSPIPAVEDINPHQQGQYKIVNGRIYANTDFNMLYRAEVAQLTGITDITSAAAVVELPTVFADLIVKVSVMILTNSADTDVMMREISRLADNLIPQRRYSNIKVRMPFKV